ncbi:SPOR domain-containing protein [Oceanicola sp. 502str15]|uniref:SPOR domain-containing protein n=1 Tax=Oceanicola sp. 502str15 TaxID=2696061 RepID=UPI002094F644
MFVRAGFDGAVTWVPRMSRSRNQICGVRPTFAEAPKPEAPVVADAPATTAAPAAEPKTRVVRRQAATTPAKPATTTTRRVATTAPKTAAPKTQTRTVTREVARSQPKRTSPANKPMATVAGSVSEPRGKKTTYRVIRRGTTPEETPLRTRRASASEVVAAADPAQKRVRGGRTITRNGKTVIVISRDAAAGAQPRTTTTRKASAPRVVRREAKPAAGTQVATAPGPAQVRTPRGYKRVWTDGRLNPNRGERTQAGREQMALVWTQDVPHRLIDVRSGRDVTALRSEMVYPYTDYAEQQRDLGPRTVVRRTSASTKSVRKTVVSTSTAPRAAEQAAPKTRRVVKKIVRNKSTGEIISVSTKSAPKKTVAKTVVKQAKASPAPSNPAAAAGGRYIQVGTFGVASNARQTAARLRGAGLPVRTQGITRGGKALTIVMAGPLAGGALNDGVRKARAMGFSDAFVR